MELGIKKKQPNQEFGERPKQTYLQRYTDDQQIHEKMLKLTNYQRNVNQNYNEVLPHNSQNVHNQEIYKQ